MLNEKLASRIKDCSDDKRIAFGFECENCGKLWEVISVPFTVKADNETEQVIRDAQYHREWVRVKADSSKAFREHFSICPICGKIVCDYCFVICDEIEMCSSCAKELGKQGTTVKVYQYHYLHSMPLVFS